MIDGGKNGLNPNFVHGQIPFLIITSAVEQPTNGLILTLIIPPPLSQKLEVAVQQSED